MNCEKVDVVILGAGLCGMAAATQLAEHAVVLERSERPGGLVRTHRLGDWWFDEVLHLLYFHDAETGRVVKSVMGDDLVSCPPQAFCVTPTAISRYPFQMHLGAFPPDVITTCIADLARATFGPGSARPARHFEEALESSHGRGLCDAFLFAYNRKLWKRPLNTLAPSNFQWNIPKPQFEHVVRGAVDVNYQYRSYNAHGYYPRPPRDAPLRGMEVLSEKLSHHVTDLRREHQVLEIDISTRRVRVRHLGEDRAFEYRHACLCTLPLPHALQMIKQTPAALRAHLQHLVSNRVDMVYFAVEGPRPEGTGHWQYYSDETIVFDRLIFMHAFDPLTAPATGWGVMAEVTARSESDAADAADLIAQCENDARRIGAFTPAHSIVASAVRTVDPAYVVFTPENIAMIERARAFLLEGDVTPLGRYGRWEYSSMAQVMGDGFRFGRAWGDRLGVETSENLRYNLTTTVDRA